MNLVDDNGTYLEDFLSSVELLPYDVRRDFELIKELDRECLEMNKELIAKQDIYYQQQQLLLHETLKDIGDQFDKQNELEILGSQIISLKTRISNILREKIVIASNVGTQIEKITKKLDSDLAFFETELKGCGEFEISKGAEPGAEVAFQIESGQSSSLILGQVISFNAETGVYEILDIDDNKKYHLPESQVVILELNDDSHPKRFSKGETVYALYPDTTSFYNAMVIHAPRRTSVGSDPLVVVQFDGDEDNDTGTISPAINNVRLVKFLRSGVSPQVTVALKYVIRNSNPAICGTS